MQSIQKAFLAFKALKAAEEEAAPITAAADPLEEVVGTFTCLVRFFLDFACCC